MSKALRRNPRFECMGGAEVQLSVDTLPCPAKIVDLSVEGCLLVFKEAQHVSGETVAELTFKVNKLPFRVRGQVRTIRSDTTVGFQFTLLSGRVRRQLEDLMEEMAEDFLKNVTGNKNPTKTLSQGMEAIHG